MKAKAAKDACQPGRVLLHGRLPVSHVSLSRSLSVHVHVRVGVSSLKNTLLDFKESRRNYRGRNPRIPSFKDSCRRRRIFFRRRFSSL